MPASISNYFPTSHIFFGRPGGEGSVSKVRKDQFAQQRHSTIQAGGKIATTDSDATSHISPPAKKINVEGEGEGNYLPKARPSGSNIQATGYR